MQSPRFQILRFEERFSKRLRFRDGLMWPVGLTVEIQLRLQSNFSGLVVDGTLEMFITLIYLPYNTITLYLNCDVKRS